MNVITYFSSYGIPNPNLSPVIKIREVSTKTVVVDNKPMTLIADGFYIFDFNLCNETKEYILIIDSKDISTDGGQYQVNMIQKNQEAGSINMTDIVDKIWGVDSGKYDDIPNSIGAKIKKLDTVGNNFNGVGI